MWLVTFRRKSSIDGLVCEHLLGYLSLLLQIVEEICPSCEFLLAPSPGNVLGEVLGHKAIYSSSFSNRERLPEALILAAIVWTVW